METWSDGSVHAKFSIKLFIDTNILSYLVDNTYPSLTEFIAIAEKCDFIELVSSKYVIFEFVGIRKKEHYLRKVASKSKIATTGEVNFSSLLKYQNKYEAPDVDFNIVIADIKKAVDDEINKIATEHKINYDYSVLHEDQLEPTFEICLSTKITNQDSLVLISSVLPRAKETSTNLHLLTNDADFVKFYNKSVVDPIFLKYKIDKPVVNSIDDIFAISGKNSINLKDSLLSRDRIKEHLKTSIISLIKDKNQEYYLGETFQPASVTFPADLVCFKLRKDTIVPNNIFITVIGSDLNFIYTTKVLVEALWHGNSPLPDNYISPADRTVDVAYKLMDIDDAGLHIPVDNVIINSLRSKGNLVFIHPDT